MQNNSIIVSQVISKLDNLPYEQASNMFNTMKLKDGEEITWVRGDKVVKTKGGKIV